MLILPDPANKTRERRANPGSLPSCRSDVRSAEHRRCSLWQDKTQSFKARHYVEMVLFFKEKSIPVSRSIFMVSSFVWSGLPWCSLSVALMAQTRGEIAVPK